MELSATTAVNKACWRDGLTVYSIVCVVTTHINDYSSTIHTSQQVADSQRGCKGTERLTTDPDPMGNTPSEDAGDADLAPGIEQIRSATPPVPRHDGPARQEIADYPPTTMSSPSAAVADADELGSAAENSTLALKYV